MTAPVPSPEQIEAVREFLREFVLRGYDHSAPPMEQEVAAVATLLARREAAARDAAIEECATVSPLMRAVFMRLRWADSVQEAIRALRSGAGKEPPRE